MSTRTPIRDYLQTSLPWKIFLGFCIVSLAVMILTVAIALYILYVLNPVMRWLTNA